MRKAFRWPLLADHGGRAADILHPDGKPGGRAGLADDPRQGRSRPKSGRRGPAGRSGIPGYGRVLAGRDLVVGERSTATSRSSAGTGNPSRSWPGPRPPSGRGSARPANAAARPARPEVEVKETRDGLLVRTPTVRRPGQAPGRELRAPRPQLVDLTGIRISEGNLDVSDVFGRLEVSVDQGDLSVSNYSGPVRADRRHGRRRCRGPRPPRRRRDHDNLPPGRYRPPTGIGRRGPSSKPTRPAARSSAISTWARSCPPRPSRDGSAREARP